MTLHPSRHTPIVRPPRLRPGQTLRVIAPSRSLAIVPAPVRREADRRIEQLGFRLSFGRHVDEEDRFGSSSLDARLEDLHDAFADPDVGGILTAIGGFNCNQLLNHIDYGLIQRHPKIFCGYSDITAIQAAILTQASVETYSGPHYSTFGMLRGGEYTIASFLSLLTGSVQQSVEPSAEWSDDSWYLDQENRTFIPNPGPSVIREGVGEGILVGGNLCTLNLLQGTRFMPPLRGAVVFLEDDAGSNPMEFDRDLQSLMHLPDFPEIRGLIIGRFQAQSRIDVQTADAIVRTKSELPNVPVVCGMDIGHTSPIATLPMGGHARLEAMGRSVRFTLA